MKLEIDAGWFLLIYFLGKELFQIINKHLDNKKIELRHIEKEDDKLWTLE